jgi:hypothetical protein
MINNCRGCLFLICGLAIASSGVAQVQSQSPVKGGEKSEHSQAELDDISVRNALAQPSGERAFTASPGKSDIEVDGSALVPLPINRVILEVIAKMPTGGDYRASSESIQKLESAIKKVGDRLSVDPTFAKPSFCSSATYLVFVSALTELCNGGQIRFNPAVAEKLLVTGQPDGVGVWGRWNANGPGTARLFAELHLGHNFSSIQEAQPGDFLKIFWNDQIGFKEFGHSVVYLRHGLNSQGIEVVKYWSSNKKGGYGLAEVPRSKIKGMLFSRLDSPGRINEIGAGLKPDQYLASMLVRSSTPEEMKEMVGIPASPGTDPVSAAAIETENNAGAKHPTDDGGKKNEYQTTP